MIWCSADDFEMVVGRIIADETIASGGMIGLVAIIGIGGPTIFGDVFVPVTLALVVVVAPTNTTAWPPLPPSSGSDAGLYGEPGSEVSLDVVSVPLNVATPLQ